MLYFVDQRRGKQFSLTGRGVSFRIQIPRTKIPPTSLHMRSNNQLNSKEAQFAVQQKSKRCFGLPNSSLQLLHKTIQAGI